MPVNPISLKELNVRVKDKIQENFPLDIWVVAEIAEINRNNTGHCYLELVERKDDSENIEARCRAIIWAYTFRMLEPYFQSSTGQDLQSGLKVMFKVQVTFHEIYGYSLNIKDVDPSYTIGEQELQRKRIIDQLLNDGVFDMNKELVLPVCPQHIAVISSDTAAGFQDFMNQLTNNSYGYSFNVKLFPAIMQGQETTPSVIHALDEIHQHECEFDLVAIIRGGGAKLDLSSFDHYDLAYYITQYPLPVITGIGHERDDTIVDMISHTRLKTPTAVADFLIGNLLEYETHIDNLCYEIVETTKENIFDEKESLLRLVSDVHSATQLNINNQQKKLHNTIHAMSYAGQRYFQIESDKLNKKSADFRKLASIFYNDNRNKLKEISLGIQKSTSAYMNQNYKDITYYQKTLDLLSPKNILKRGYSITLRNGKAIKNSNELKQGEEIETRFLNGKSISTVKNISNE